MKFLGKVIKFLSTSNVQRIWFRAFVNPASHFRIVLDEIAELHRARIAAPLRRFVSQDTANLMVAMIGDGYREGFACDALSRQDTPLMIGEDWWAGVEPDLYLFCYSCYSAEFLRSAYSPQNRSGSIGFENRIWHCFDTTGSDTTRFWTWFLSRLMSELESTDSIRADALCALRRFLYSVVKLETGPPNSDRSSFKYHLNLICVMRQARQMRFCD
jgi:hypothetical protein